MNTQDKSQLTAEALPTIWFRNTWSWGCEHEGCTPKPRLHRAAADRIEANHFTLKRFHLDVDAVSFGGRPTMLFTENETNLERLGGTKNSSAYAKDGVDTFIVNGDSGSVNPQEFGTKAAVHRVVQLAAGESITLQLRLYSDDETPAESFGTSYQKVFDQRVREADEFYAERIDSELDGEYRSVSRQAYAGLMWSKQFYHYSVKDSNAIVYSGRTWKSTLSR